MVLLTAFVILVFVYSLLSRRLERTVVTAPMLFTAAGAAVSFLPIVATELVVDRNVMLLVAELGLVMLLFTDACRISPRLLNAGRGLPIRLLSTGMLLTLLLGAVCAVVVFPGLSWWEAGILAAILAPTDAGLGQVIVNSEEVPTTVRQSLNVEAGLNDGLSVPFLLLFIALAVAHAGDAGPGSVLTRFLVEQLGYGTLFGIGIGGAGGWLLGLAHRARWMAPPLAQLGVVALPLLCAIASEAGGASMFIAAFVAGVAIQFGFGEASRHSVEFTEDWGQLFNYFVFFLFGAIVAGAIAQFTPSRAGLRGAEPDAGADAAGGAGAPRDPPLPRDGAVHGLVRPPGPRLHRARAGLSRARSAPARRADDPPRGDGDGAFQHLRARLERAARDQALRQAGRGARSGIPGTAGGRRACVRRAAARRLKRAHRPASVSTRRPWQDGRYAALRSRRGSIRWSVLSRTT